VLTGVEQLRFCELAGTNQVGNDEGIPNIILGAVQLVAFTVLLDGIGVDQSVGNVAHLEIGGQQLPEVISGLHTHEHGRGLVLLTERCEAPVEEVVPVPVVGEREPGQPLCASCDCHRSVTVSAKVDADEQRAWLDVGKFLC
jgi:hypothetical protein